MMRHKGKFLFLGLLFSFFASCGQVPDSTGRSPVVRGKVYTSMLVGYNGWSNNFLEAGIARHQMNTVGHHPFEWTAFLASEVKLSSKETIVGPKIGVWAGGGIVFGVSVIYYTDFLQGAWRVRPEIGGGYDFFKFTYGYNMSLSGEDFNGINRDVITVIFLLRGLDRTTKP